ncbi:MAG TPA: hypothetical protein VFR02_04345 [bacterium]|nr:hypothetical protein [bacterium]
MLNPEQVQLASTAVRGPRAALSNFFLYSAENAMVRQALDRGRRNSRGNSAGASPDGPRDPGSQP